MNLQAVRKTSLRGHEDSKPRAQFVHSIGKGITMALTPAETFEEIADDLTSTTSAQKTKMFGMPSLKSNGKAFAGFYREAMIFKLGESARSEALALTGAKLFDPMGGRPMKEWVEVPPEHKAHWAALARFALENISH